MSCSAPQVVQVKRMRYRQQTEAAPCAGLAILASIHMLLNDTLGQCWPRLLLPYIVNNRTDTGRGHVIDNNVRLGCETLEQLGKSVQVRHLPAVVSATGGPQK